MSDDIIADMPLKPLDLLHNVEQHYCTLLYLDSDWGWCGRGRVSRWVVEVKVGSGKVKRDMEKGRCCVEKKEKKRKEERVRVKAKWTKSMKQPGRKEVQKISKETDVRCSLFDEVCM